LSVDLKKKKRPGAVTLPRRFNAMEHRQQSRRGLGITDGFAFVPLAQSNVRRKYGASAQSRAIGAAGTRRGPCWDERARKQIGARRNRTEILCFSRCDRRRRHKKHRASEVSCGEFETSQWGLARSKNRSVKSNFISPSAHRLCADLSANRRDLVRRG
jgi:hypothetical protein